MMSIVNLRAASTNQREGAVPVGKVKLLSNTVSSCEKYLLRKGSGFILCSSFNEQTLTSSGVIDAISAYLFKWHKCCQIYDTDWSKATFCLETDMMDFLLLS